MASEMTLDEMAQKIVRDDVFCNVGQLVEFSLKMAASGENDAPVTWEDFEAERPDFDVMDREELLAYLEENVSANMEQYADLDDYDLISECEDNYETPEVYEFWAVSGWLADKLRERGEAVADNYPDIWGRATTGQSIVMDSVIRDIARYLINL
jgi:hypothetical protein